MRGSRLDVRSIPMRDAIFVLFSHKTPLLPGCITRNWKLFDRNCAKKFKVDLLLYVEDYVYLGTADIRTDSASVRVASIHAPIL